MRDAVSARAAQITAAKATTRAGPHLVPSTRGGTCGTLPSVHRTPIPNLKACGRSSFLRLRAAAFAAFIAGCLLLFLNPPSFAHLGGLLTILVGAIAIVLITAWVTTLAIGKEMPEPEFRACRPQ